MTTRGRQGLSLPPGVTSPYFVCELALELGMPVGEMLERMSLHELTVIWPQFFRSRRAVEKWQRKEQER